MHFIHDLEKFYKNKKVFITGHTGFKGSWLSLWLKKLGAEVTAYSLPPEGESLFELANIKDEINSVFGDTRNYDDLFAALKNSKAEIVIHMAAQAFTLESYRDPVKTFQTNVLGTINLLEAVRKAGTVKAVVNVTSDKCYENMELNLPFKETDRLGGHDPYSASKACAELVTTCWRSSFFEKENLLLASARAGNVIGGGDFSKDRIIPDIIRSLQKGEKPLLRSPNATRPWQHVLEPLSGYMVLAMRVFNEGKKFTSAYNFGPDGENVITVEDVTKELIKYLGSGDYRIQKDESFYEAKTLRLDNSKAREELNWRPTFNFDKTIESTANWYSNYFSQKVAIKDFTLDQIDKFCDYALKK